jgi:UDP-2,3-diacylglucosamine pyrophosphatase LpxH
MKIQYMSDLHLEFGYMDIPPKVGDVLVLAGDIHVGSNGVPWIKECAKVFDHTFYILGNHEFYHNSITDLHLEVATLFEEIPNVTFLNNDRYVWDGVNFIGTTLWSEADDSLRYKMNDFSLVKKGLYSRFSPLDARLLHEEARVFLHDSIDPRKKNVVITHHAPSLKSHNVSRYGAPSSITTGYCSDIINEFNPKDITVWIHGHTHDNVDYIDNDINIVSNQRGYINHELAYGYPFDPCRMVEI